MRVWKDVNLRELLVDVLLYPDFKGTKDLSLMILPIAKQSWQNLQSKVVAHCVMSAESFPQISSNAQSTAEPNWEAMPGLTSELRNVM